MHHHDVFSAQQRADAARRYRRLAAEPALPGVPACYAVRSTAIIRSAQGRDLLGHGESKLRASAYTTDVAPRQRCAPCAACRGSAQTVAAPRHMLSCIRTMRSQLAVSPLARRPGEDCNACICKPHLYCYTAGMRLATHEGQSRGERSRARGTSPDLPPPATGGYRTATASLFAVMPARRACRGRPGTEEDKELWLFANRS